jgi:DinB superfamily
MAGPSGWCEGRTSVPSSFELMRAEDAGWNELHALVDSLTPEEAERPGYYDEGWSAADMLAHIGSWLAAAGAVLERIRAGTYQPEEIDVDAWNERFLRAMKGVPFPDVKAQAFASRARMLQAWNELGELTPDAAFWIGKAGADHYAEHLPRLREWVAELHTGGNP